MSCGTRHQLTVELPIVGRTTMEMACVAILVTEPRGVRPGLPT